MCMMFHFYIILVLTSHGTPRLFACSHYSLCMEATAVVSCWAAWGAVLFVLSLLLDVLYVWAVPCFARDGHAVGMICGYGMTPNGS